MAAPKPDPLLEGPTLLKARWKTTKQIGAGAFGEIYRGVDVLTQQEVAVKVEKVNSKKQVLRLEVAVLKKMQSSEYVCRFIYCGRHSNVNYLVMQLLGRNLSELRREQAGGKLSLSTACRLGIQMLRSIEDVHEAGYLHRDVKPSNFAIGLDQFHDTCFIIDFGLARRYVLSNGEVRPPRESTGFRGTARYASINSHLGNELARRDDLWSLVYVMVEFTRGQLPWRRIKEKEHIGEYKQRIPMLELLDGLPVELWDIVQHVESLQYADRPDYDYVVECLETICRKIHAPPDDKYDWERTPAEKVAAHQVLTLYDVACVNYEPPSPRNSTDAQLLLAPDSGGGNQLNVPGGNMYSMGSLASNSTRAQSRGMTTEMSSMFMSGGSYVFEKDGENGIFDSYGNLQGTPTGSGIGAHRMSGSSLGTGVGLDSNDPGHTPMPGVPEHPDGVNPAAGGGPTGTGAGEVVGDQEVGGEGGTRNKTETEDDSGSVCKCVIL